MGIADGARTDDVFDYGADDRPVRTVSQDQLARLTRLCQEQMDLEDEMVRVQAQLKALADRHREISQRQIPDIAKECGFSGYELTGGYKLKVKDDIKVKLYEDPERRADQIQWLDDHGQSAIVKRQYIVSFAKEQTALANKFAADLKRRKTPLAVDLRMDVHNGTLTAAIKEMIRNGVAVPYKDKFQGFDLREAKIERPKK